MSFYIKSIKNKYNIDTVYSYSQNTFDGYNYKFDTEPKLGQYIINNQLVSDDQYDTLVAPIIANAVDDNAGVVEEVVIYEAPPIVEPEPAPAQEYWKNHVSQEELDELRERANSLQKLIAFASNSAHINSDNKLVMNVYIRSGEPRDPPFLLDILDPANNINTVSDYINMLTEQLTEINTKAIPWVQAELSKNK